MRQQIIAFRNIPGNGQKWKSVDTVLEHMGKLREYDRMKKALLRKTICDGMKSTNTTVIEILRSENVKLDDHTELDEDVEYSDSEEEDEEVELVEVKDSNMLNNSLLNKYSAIGKEKQEEKRKSDKSTMKAKKPKNESKSEGGYLVTEQPLVSFKDFGGIEKCLEDIRELIERPFRHPEVYSYLGVDPPRGILLHGPPGCGKTCLASAIAFELGIPLLKISAPEVVSGMSGESEAKVRELFEQARDLSPSIIFIDEIDAITPKRETAQREMERRIVAQLLTCMDDLAEHPKPVIVVGATNRPDSLDPALRRAGRFDREIKMGVPDERSRLQILKVLTAKLKIDGELDLQSIAKRTPGYVGADLKALQREAAAAAISRIFKELERETLMQIDSIPSEEPAEESFELSTENLEKFFINKADFEIALTKVQPSAKREGFAVVPDVTWNDIGALSFIREELRMAVVEPAIHPEKFAAVGITSPSGVLLWGPPGCGKTLLAKAVANESHSNFISVKGPELLNKYVGESERAIRQVFERARSSAPCVIFFDELDALCPRRSDESNSYSSRLVNQLLTELDGMEERKQVYVIAATNRPDIIDPAMIRPGRLDKLLYVELPTAQERFEILKTLSKKTPLKENVDLLAIAVDSRCDGFSGADLSSLVKEASLGAVRNSLYSSECEEVFVTMEHFEEAFSKVFPSVSQKDRMSYDKLRREFAGNRLKEK